LILVKAHKSIISQTSAEKMNAIIDHLQQTIEEITFDPFMDMDHRRETVQMARLTMNALLRAEVTSSNYTHCVEVGRYLQGRMFKRPNTATSFNRYDVITTSGIHCLDNDLNQDEFKFDYYLVTHARQYKC
jgi:hypothetical protein